MQIYDQAATRILGCGEKHTEKLYGNFAPRNTFGEEADSWPTAALCRNHHVEWHKRMDGYLWQRRGSVAA